MVIHVRTSLPPLHGNVLKKQQNNIIFDSKHINCSLVGIFRCFFPLHFNAKRLIMTNNRKSEKEMANTRLACERAQQPSQQNTFHIQTFPIYKETKKNFFSHFFECNEQRLYVLPYAEYTIKGIIALLSRVEMALKTPFSVVFLSRNYSSLLPPQFISQQTCTHLYYIFFHRNNNSTKNAANKQQAVNMSCFVRLYLLPYV